MTAWPPDSSDLVPLDADDFPASYKFRMLASYPVIAGMTPDEAWAAGQEEREVAFGRILRARNLHRTHVLFLATLRAER